MGEGHTLDTWKGAQRVESREKERGGGGLEWVEWGGCMGGEKSHPGDEKPDELADSAARLAAEELERVGVLLLGHQGGARRVGVGQLDEAELRGRVEDEVFFYTEGKGRESERRRGGGERSEGGGERGKER